MFNDVTITQNETNMGNETQVPYIPQPINSNMKVIITPSGERIIVGENNVKENANNNIEIKKEAYLRSKYYGKEIKYGLRPIKMICPKCYELMETNVYKTCDTCKLFTFIFIPCFCISILMDKDAHFLCIKATHYCSNCGLLLGKCTR